MLKNITDIENLFDQLFPLPRSITGEGYRESLNILMRYIPFQVGRVASGTKVFDWTVPPEWVIEDAFLIDPHGNKILDFKKNNLHVVNYSEPIDRVMELEELNKNLHSIPNYPDWVPYVTSYYKKTWGFCLSDKQRQELKPGNYQVVIKSFFVDGCVEYGYKYLRSNLTGKESGVERKLILISSYLCHPSLANNELSGPIVLAALYERIAQWQNKRFDYLFVINPETIGSICFLHQHGEEIAKSMQAGLVLTCVGGPSEKLSYKKSRRGDSTLDKLFLQLEQEGSVEIRDFDPSEGSDERQYCSSGFNLPVGQVAKTTYGFNPEYHTSADNKDFVELEKFPDTVTKIENILKIHEYLLPLEREEPYCEIQLGRRGLYPNINSPQTWDASSDSLVDHREQLKAMMYILSYADGKHDLVDIAKLTKIKMNNLCDYAKILINAGVLK
jgi:aminopeptidase-like protein